MTSDSAGCSSAATCWMDAAAVRGRTLIVRGWQSGDWMTPCGFPHRRKLQDIFVTAKVPPSVRRSVPVVADAETGEVLWIPGYRVSEAVKVSSATAPSLKLSISQNSYAHMGADLRSIGRRG